MPNFSNHNELDKNLSIRISNTNNLIDGRFKVLIDRRVEKFSNEFGDCYEVEDTKEAGNFYCFAHFSHMPQRVNAIQKLEQFQEDFRVITPKTLIINQLGSDNHYQLCTIFPKIENAITLTQFVAEGGLITENFLVDKLLLTMVKTLMIYENLGIAHGNINPDNIYIADKEIILGDSIRSSCGFYQHLSYEPLERMISNNFAKGETNTSTDYFALGITILQLINGIRPLTGYSDSNIISMRLRDGSYYSYMRDNANLSSNFKGLMKGLLSDRIIDRWSTAKVVEWMKGRKYNVPVLSLYKSALRYYTINKNQHYNTASAAYELLNDWHNAKRLLKEPKFKKWLESSLSQDDIAMRIQYAEKMNGISFSNFAIDDDEFIARCLISLDHITGIKYQNISFSFEAMGNMLHYAFASGKQEIFRVVSKFISGGVFPLLLEINATDLNSEQMQFIPLIEKCRGFFNVHDPACGLERVLYEVSYLAPCQSKLLQPFYCFDLVRLMNILEKISDQLDPNALDRHIIAFIYAKLDIKKELGLAHLGKYKQIVSNKLLINLNILSQAQKKTKLVKLVNLAEKFSESLKPVINSIYHSKSLKKNICEKIDNYKNEGDLSLLLDISANLTTITKDKMGFSIASKKFETIENSISTNNNHTKMYDRGYIYGLRIGMVFSYIICAIIIIYSLSKSI